MTDKSAVPSSERINVAPQEKADGKVEGDNKPAPAGAASSVTADGPLGGWRPVGPAAVQLDFMLAQLEATVAELEDPEIDPDHGNRLGEEVLKLKREIIDRFASSSTVAHEPVTDLMGKLKKALADRSSTAPIMDADKWLAHQPWHSNGGDKWYSADTVRAAVRQAHLLSLPSATDALEKLAALMQKEECDVDICPPGYHGGSGADSQRWLVTLTPSDHNRIREFFGDTITEAINYATRDGGADGK